MNEQAVQTHAIDNRKLSTSRRRIGSALLTAAATAGIVLAFPSTAQAATAGVVGSFDQVSQSATGQLQVFGWAANQKAPGSKVQLHVYVNGPAGQQLFGGIFTSGARPDVAAAYSWAGANQGFSATLPSTGSGAGANSVCVYAIDSVAPATNTLLGCRTLTTLTYPPVGTVDSVTVTDHSAVVSGWAFDPNQGATSIPVHVYVKNAPGNLSQGAPFIADDVREDVNAAYSMSGQHGFSRTVALGDGTNTVCAYAIGFNGNNALAGKCYSVTTPTVPVVQQAVMPVPSTPASTTPASTTPAPTTPAPTTPAPTTPVPAPKPAKPDASNTGVPSGTALTRYTGPLTITTDGTIISNADIYGDLKVQARNVIIRNSRLHCGDQIPAYNTGCIDANAPAVFNLLIENNTIIPDKPSYYRDGIVGHEFTARGNHITHSNDGIGIFNRPGGSLDANVTVENNYIHDLTRWNNDPAHSDGTHNDGIQIQGGRNITIRSNTIIGSVVAGDGLGKYGNHGGSAIIVNQNVSQVGNLVVDKNWLDDAQNSVSIQTDKFPTVTLTMTDNMFGHNQYDFGNGSTYQIRVASKTNCSVTGLTSNRWDDTGVAFAEGRNTGIRYMAP